jgi:pimeloyl-ACP methyl ester carboxylesterase
MIATQVQRLSRQTGRPVDLVAESEGTLGVYAMFARHPDVPVGSIVLLSPILGPGQASFPDPGQQGPGMVSGYALRALDSFLGGLSQFGTSGAQRLLESVSSVGASYAASASRGKARRWLALVPLADAVTLPVCNLPQNVMFVPALHGGLLGDQPVLSMVASFLAGHSVSAPQEMREAAELVTSAALPWRMPQTATPSASCG